MTRISRLAPFALAAALPGAVAGAVAGAQQPNAAPGGAPAVRQLGAVAAATTEPLGMVTNVRAISGGRILVNDVARRRVLLFDSTMTSFTVVADSTSSTANAYGPRPGALVPYRGDSTLFVDPASMSMLVVDPAGKIARVTSIPRSQDANALGSGAMGGAGFDPAGRLVYRAPFTFNFRSGGPGGPGAGGPPAPPQQPDSAAIVRVDLATRQLDTVAFIRVPAPRININRSDDGRVSVSTEINPLPLTDEWAMLPDGTVAIVRGRDYHVDWVAPDGTRSASPKVAFDWQRLSDDDKVALIDSVKAMRERMAAAAPAGGAPAAGAAMAMAGGMGGAMVITRTGPDGAPGPRPREGAAGTTTTMTAPTLNFVSPSELPDYKPPFLAGAVRADADGRIWVRTVPTKAIPGGPVYDVLDRTGAVVERVQIPENRQILGFGPGGVVYLVSRDASALTTPGTGQFGMPTTGTKIERAQLR